MKTEDRLLDAIDADPDDDAPRLAHADWLDAHGHADRAAYVRDSLRSEHDTYYLRTRDQPTLAGMSWECRRGYPEVVRFDSMAAFEKGWPLARDARPRHVVFRHLRGVARLVRSPALASIRSLELTCIDAAGVLAVLRSPHLGTLRHLAVGPNHPEDLSLLPELARLPALASLRSLSYSFSSYDLSSEPVASLLESPHLRGLRRLRFQGWLSAEAMRTLWRSSPPGLTALEILAGSGWVGGATAPGGLADLGDGGATPSLERFRFDYPVGDQDARAVAGATRWANLRELEISNSGVNSGPGVGDAGAAALAAATPLRRLRRLTLQRDGLSDAGAEALAGADWPELSHLDLSWNVVGRAGVRALGRTASLPRLRTLTLEGNAAPASLVEAVVARFREGGPPLADAPAVPAQPLPPTSAPVIGSPDEDGLVRAIWADPWDGLARSAYADWLEEQSAPHQAAALRADTEGRAVAAARAHDAMAADAPFPFESWLTPEGLVAVRVPVRSLRSKASERDGPAWLRRHHVAELTPQGSPSDWKALFAAGWLAHTRGLRLGERPRESHAGLAESPHLAGLASLSLDADAWRADVAGFLRAAGLRGLCRLSYSGLSWDALRAIIESPFAANLRNLGAGWLQDDGLALLAESPAFAGLVTLSLRVNGATYAKVLGDATGLASLRNLDLTASWLPDAGADALAGSGLLRRLRRLGVSPGTMSAAAALRLAWALPAGCRLAVRGAVTPELAEGLREALNGRLDRVE